MRIRPINKAHAAVFSACISLCFLLAACQQSATYAPQATPEEIANEQALQAQMADNARKRTTRASGRSDAQLIEQYRAVAINIEKAGKALCEEMQLPQSTSCIYDFHIEKNEALNAYADGQKIVVYTGMLHFVDNADELAAVMSHEFAHNVMGHPASTRTNVTIGAVLGTALDALASSQGFNTQGLLGQQGARIAQLRYSKSFEREADYVGVYIMARAGYDLAQAPYFWRHMAVENPQGIYSATTHPTTAERFVTIQKAMNEIKSKKALNLPLLPERITPP